MGTQGRQLLGDALWHLHLQGYVTEHNLIWFWSMVDSIDQDSVDHVFEKLYRAYLGPSFFQDDELGYQVPQYSDLDAEAEYKLRHKRIVEVYHHSLLSVWIRKAFAQKAIRESILATLASIELAIG